jgi:hypothetical protein
MLWNASVLRGFEIEATDGQIGTVDDLLFDDQSWQLRWVVVHTGMWLFGRKVLLPLSALGKPNGDAHNFTVKRTKQQVQDSPDIFTDLPVSRQLEARVYQHYDWNPYWQTGFAEIANRVCTPVYMEPQQVTGATEPDVGDPHLRSAMAMVGYHIEAQGGAIGHAEDFIIDDEGWHIRYVVIDTKNWLPGKHVVISPQMIRDMDWIGHSIYLHADVAKIKASPPYDPDMIDNCAFRKLFHKHFGLPEPADKRPHG